MIRIAPRWAAGLAALALACSAPAEAQQITYGGVGQQRGVTYSRPSPYLFALPGELASFTIWGGLRAYSRAQCTGSVRALTLRRASDDATANINILSTCDLDVATAAAHCAATSCFVAEVCDQVGSSDCSATHDLVQATAANQPEFVFNCMGARPCMRAATATTQVLSANSRTPATGVMTLTTVANRSVAGGGSCSFVRANATNNRIITTAAANTWQILTPSAGTINRTGADAAWHAAVGVWNTTSSVFNLDGTEATGTITGNTTAGVPGGVLGSATATCDQVEVGIIDNVALTAAQRQTLVSAARGYWGF